MASEQVSGKHACRSHPHDILSFLLASVLVTAESADKACESRAELIDKVPHLSQRRFAQFNTHQPRIRR
jgi:hypothetical protein